MIDSKMSKKEEFKALILNPVKYRLFLITKLPMAYMAGLRIPLLNDEKAAVTIKYKYLTQNPFRSIYFACLAMAAELSCGVLAMLHTYKTKPPISMLVVGMEAEFTKKAVGKITFTCANGREFESLANETLATGESRTLRAESIGIDEKGDQVARFYVTWSLKAKSSRA